MKKISFIFVIGFINLIGIFFHTKQLHFFHSNQYDIGMDFFNTLYYTLEGSYYSFFSSVYLPLNFYILELLPISKKINLDQIILREKFFIEVYFFMLLFSLFFFYYFIKKSKISSDFKPQLFIIFATSVPFLYLVERANLLILCIPFIFMLFNKKTINFSLAVLVNFKIYFLFLLLFIKNKNQSYFKFLILCIFLFLISVVSINQNFEPTSFLITLFGFDNFLNDSTATILTLTYSPFTFEKLQYYENGNFFYKVASNSSFLYFCYFILTSIQFKFFFFFLNFYLIWFKKIKTKYSICISFLFLLTFLGGSAGGYLGILILPIILFLIEDDFKRNKSIIVLLLLSICPIDIIFWEASYGFRNEYSFFLNDYILTHFNYGIFQIFRAFLLFTAYVNLLYLRFNESSNFSRRFWYKTK